MGDRPRAVPVPGLEVKRRIALSWLGATLSTAAAAGTSGSHPHSYTVEDRVRLHAPTVERRLKRKFASAGLPYPPASLAYVAFKDVARMEVYARATETGAWRRVVAYPILRMSGTLGPKLREGDGQVPEGVYRAEFLNANSRFHLSIRLDYPNAFDRAQARAEGRTRLGSDIMIHGSNVSIGCMAMGDQAAEDLFILAALTGKERVSIVVAPTDFRRPAARVPKGGPPWVAGLYRHIKAALNPLPSGG